MVNTFPDNPSEYAVVYQWWTSSPRLPVHRNLAIPLISSMATFRAHQPHVPIYVLDYSGDHCEWSDFPQRLRFEVVRQRPGLADISFRREPLPVEGEIPREDRVFRNHLSRPMDVRALASRIPQRYIIYSDSDILWMEGCLPKGEDSDLLHCRADNTGVFYFDKESERAEEFLRTWTGLCMLASRDRAFRAAMYEDQRQFTAVQDEMVFVYIRQKMKEHFYSCVNILPSSVCLGPEEFNRCAEGETRSIHVQGWRFRRNRGCLPWMLREFSDAVRGVFSGDECQEVFKDVYKQGGMWDVASLHPGSPRWGELMDLGLFEEIGGGSNIPI